MKKSLSLLLAIMLAMPAMFAQTKNVARECVLFELLTGVKCYACPDAEHAIQYMLQQGCAIAPVAYQDPYFSVPSLYTPEVSARINYYNNQVCPDLFVDGLTEVEGCYGNTYYMSYYNNRIGVESPFTIAMNLEPVNGNRYRVNCQVDQVGDCSGTDVRVFIVLTQDHFPYSWQGETELNHLVRDMIPTEQGTHFTGSSMTFSEEFDINYPLENCHLVAWVQNYVNPREVYQAVIMETNPSPVYDETLTFDVDTLWVSQNQSPTPLTIHNNTESDVTLQKITIDADWNWYYFKYDETEFLLNEDVNIEIPSGESITIDVNMNIYNKEMIYPVLHFENTLETMSLVTAFDWVEAVWENENMKLQVYPNPSQNTFIVECEGMTDVSVYSTDGKLVKQIGNTENKCSINGLSEGVYLLRISTGNGGVVMRKIVKL